MNLTAMAQQRRRAASIHTLPSTATAGQSDGHALEHLSMAEVEMAAGVNKDDLALPPSTSTIAPSTPFASLPDDTSTVERTQGGVRQQV